MHYNIEKSHMINCTEPPGRPASPRGLSVHWSPVILFYTVWPQVQGTTLSYVKGSLLESTDKPNQFNPEDCDHCLHKWEQSQV